MPQRRRNQGKRKAAMPARRGRTPRLARPSARIIVDVINHQRTLRLAAPTLKSIVRLVLRAEGVRSATIELALVDDATIRDLHRRFLQKDIPTDVLTFPLHEAHEPLSGQIVLSVDTAARVGPLHGFTPEEEVLLYAIHGVLHLCGYDDQSPRDARRMRRRQQLLLREALDSI